MALLKHLRIYMTKTQVALIVSEQRPFKELQQ